MHLNMEPFWPELPSASTTRDTDERPSRSRLYLELKVAYPFGKRFTLTAKGEATVVCRETHVRGCTFPPPLRLYLCQSPRGHRMHSPGSPHFCPRAGLSSRRTLVAVSSLTVKQGHPTRAERSGATRSTASPQLRNLGQAVSPFFSWIPMIVRARGAGQSPHGEVRGDRLEREAVVCLRGSRDPMCSSDEQLLGGLVQGKDRALEECVRQDQRGFGCAWKTSS